MQEYLEDQQIDVQLASHAANLTTRKLTNRRLQLEMSQFVVVVLWSMIVVCDEDGLVIR